MSRQESEPIKKHLRVLTVTLDYPPPLSGGYGVMCAQVCTWLKSRGHEVLVLTAPSPEQGIVEAASGEDEGPVPVRRTLRSYWDGAACLDLPFGEALAVEQHNQAQMRDVLATYHPDVVAFWHMGALSLGLITTTARLGFPLVFVIGDDWLCYGGWADAWLRWCNEHPEQAPAIERRTGGTAGLGRIRQEDPATSRHCPQGCGAAHRRHLEEDRSTNGTTGYVELP